jgi:hypothetical protein
MGGVFNAHNLNVYCYSLNNPVKYYDPDGNQPALSIIGLLQSRVKMPAEQAIKDPEYRQGGGGHIGAKNPNFTWCNQATFDIAEATGVDITRLTLRGGRYSTRANDAFVKMLGEAIKGNLKMVDGKTAQELANAGYTVFAAAMGVEKRNGALESGHIVVVMPSINEEYDPSKGPKVAHIGSKENKVMFAVHSFGKKLFIDVKYFYDPKQKLFK